MQTQKTQFSIIKSTQKYINFLFGFFGRERLRNQQGVSTGGFTLIETLVAITLLVLAITGPLQIASNALFASFHARDEITAYYLAVEAIEYIKYSRDTLFLSDVFSDSTNINWLFGFDVCMDDGSPDFKGCYVKIVNKFDPASGDPSIVACEEDPCPALKFNESSGFWGYEGGVDTKFKRQIVITPDDTGNIDATIDVVISWPTQSILGGEKTFKLTDIITNWERI